MSTYHVVLQAASGPMVYGSFNSKGTAEEQAKAWASVHVGSNVDIVQVVGRYKAVARVESVPVSTT